MGRFLLLDIGAGTLDMLYIDTEDSLHYKAVVKSPVRDVAQYISDISGNLVVSGFEMGGGPVSSALEQRAATDSVVMTGSAARTIHHNADRVKKMGIRIIDEELLGPTQSDPSNHPVHLSDLQLDRIKGIVEGFGVPYGFDAVAICAQDHGMPPRGMSHLDFRHELFKALLDKTPRPEALLFHSREVPAEMNRLNSIARAAMALPARDIYVMDSGMAAILGASLDANVKGRKRRIVLDVATSHTVCAAIENNDICGFFEYHTRDVTLERLESLIRALAMGEISHKQILAEGGHGAYLRKKTGPEALDAILVTGPKRGLLKDSGLPLIWGAPLGDNMMTGTLGLFEAICRRTGMGSDDLQI